MEMIGEQTASFGVKPTCAGLGIGRASYYRRQSPRPRAARVGPHPRALSSPERQRVLSLLHDERFCNQAPAEVYASLLDEGHYLCSERTMYRILAENHEVRERRDQLRHPRYAAPELLATRPNEVWSWDITKLLGPTKWTYFYLYVILDIFSRYVVGWMVTYGESGRPGWRTGPNNVTCAPDAASLVAVQRSPNEVRSFTTPPLAGPVSVQRLSGLSFSGLAAAFRPGGGVLYARSNSAVDAFDYDAGVIGASRPGFPIAAGRRPTFFGMDQLALHPNGSKLYVPNPGSLDVHDANTGAFITSIVDPAIISPTGVCFQPQLLTNVQSVTEVDIDIKPGGDPNSINLRSKRVIPVAILTTDTFDASTVDPLSVKFGPGEATEAHGKVTLRMLMGTGISTSYFTLRLKSPESCAGIPPRRSQGRHLTSRRSRGQTPSTPWHVSRPRH